MNKNSHNLQIFQQIIMKRYLVIFALLSVFTIRANGQTEKKDFSYTTSIGTGIALDQPSCIPFTWQAMSHYHLHRRLAICAGTGLSVYEKPLIPLYIGAQFFITRPKRLTPYLECNIGGSFAVAKETNGGFYLSPSIGILFNISRKLKMNCSVGYELQKLERVKKHTDQYFHSEFLEKLSHQTVMIKTGIRY